jgi:peptidoglycan hydrolase-like protein with peptidoglycan-binding domain
VSRSFRVALGGGVSVLAAGAVAIAAVGFGGRGPKAASGVSDLPPATTTVTRATLSQTQHVNGTLGYGNQTTINAHGQGTVTWLPAAGATINRGQPVYRDNNIPVPLFYGTLPLYRQLKSGDSGPDVKELEQNLAALGYTGFTVDNDYTSATGDAVKRWQKDLGVAEASRTSTFSPAEVVLAADAIRVAVVKVALGDAAGGQLLTYTGTTRIVTVALDVGLQSIAKPGAAATVTLPDNHTVQGKIATIGTVATAGNGNNPATIDVTVSMADQSTLGTLDSAPVDVTLVSAQAQNVLSVPVAALVALAEGGYGVQVVEGSTSRYVAVKTGVFAGGRVEISGDGIKVGTVVGIPK